MGSVGGFVETLQAAARWRNPALSPSGPLNVLCFT